MIGDFPSLRRTLWVYSLPDKTTYKIDEAKNTPLVPEWTLDSSAMIYEKGQLGTIDFWKSDPTGQQKEAITALVTTVIPQNVLDNSKYFFNSPYAIMGFYPQINAFVVCHEGGENADGILFLQSMRPPVKKRSSSQKRKTIMFYVSRILNGWEVDVDGRVRGRK